MANKVFLNKDDVVEIIVDGDQSVSSIKAMAEAAFELCRSQRQRSKRSLILDDLSALGRVAPEGRKAVVDLIKSGEFDKFAMVGSSGMIKLGSNLMLQATGKSAYVKYFDQRGKAMQWLLESS